MIDDMTGLIDGYQDSAYIKIVKREEFFAIKLHIRSMKIRNNRYRRIRW